MFSNWTYNERAILLKGSQAIANAVEEYLLKFMQQLQVLFIQARYISWIYTKPL